MFPFGQGKNSAARPTQKRATLNVECLERRELMDGAATSSISPLLENLRKEDLEPVSSIQLETLTTTTSLSWFDRLKAGAENVGERLKDKLFEDGPPGPKDLAKEVLREIKDQAIDAQDWDAKAKSGWKRTGDTVFDALESIAEKGPLITVEKGWEVIKHAAETVKETIEFGEELKQNPGILNLPTGKKEPEPTVQTPLPSEEEIKILQEWGTGTGRFKKTITLPGVEVNGTSRPKETPKTTTSDNQQPRVPWENTPLEKLPQDDASQVSDVTPPIPGISGTGPSAAETTAPADEHDWQGWYDPATRTWAPDPVEHVPGAGWDKGETSSDGTQVWVDAEGNWLEVNEDGDVVDFGGANDPRPGATASEQGSGSSGDGHNSGSGSNSQNEEDSEDTDSGSGGNSSSNSNTTDTDSDDDGKDASGSDSSSSGDSGNASEGSAEGEEGRPNPYDDSMYRVPVSQEELNAFLQGVKDRLTTPGQENGPGMSAQEREARLTAMLDFLKTNPHHSYPSPQDTGEEGGGETDGLGIGGLHPDLIDPPEEPVTNLSPPPPPKELGPNPIGGIGTPAGGSRQMAAALDQLPGLAGAPKLSAAHGGSLGSRLASLGSFG